MNEGILGHGEAFDWVVAGGFTFAAFAWALIFITPDSKGRSEGSFLDHTGNDALTGRPTSQFS